MAFTLLPSIPPIPPPSPTLSVGRPSPETIRSESGRAEQPQFLGAHPWTPSGVVPAVFPVPDPSQDSGQVSGSCLLLKPPSSPWQESLPRTSTLQDWGPAPRRFLPTGEGSLREALFPAFWASSALQLLSSPPRSGPQLEDSCSVCHKTPDTLVVNAEVCSEWSLPLLYQTGIIFNITFIYTVILHQFLCCWSSCAQLCLLIRHYSFALKGQDGTQPIIIVTMNIFLSAPGILF